VLPGIDFTNVDFGRKFFSDNFFSSNFGQTFIQKQQIYQSIADNNLGFGGILKP
jgi:hypothetical protein